MIVSNARKKKVVSVSVAALASLLVLTGCGSSAEKEEAVAAEPTEAVDVEEAEEPAYPIPEKFWSNKLVTDRYGSAHDVEPEQFELCSLKPYDYDTAPFYYEDEASGDIIDLWHKPEEVMEQPAGFHDYIDSRDLVMCADFDDTVGIVLRQDDETGEVFFGFGPSEAFVKEKTEPLIIEAPSSYRDSYGPLTFSYLRAPDQEILIDEYGDEVQDEDGEFVFGDYYPPEPRSTYVGASLGFRNTEINLYGGVDIMIDNMDDPLTAPDDPRAERYAVISFTG